MGRMERGGGEEGEVWMQSKERRRGGVGVIGWKVGGKMRGSKRRREGRRRVG